MAVPYQPAVGVLLNTFTFSASMMSWSSLAGHHGPPTVPSTLCTPLTSAHTSLLELHLTSRVRLAITREHFCECSLAQTPVPGWLEAFAEHPRIGDVAGLKAKFGAFADLSRDEQSAAAATADDAVYQVTYCGGFQTNERCLHGGCSLNTLGLLTRSGCWLTLGA